ncbi:MAG: hypothetical protein JW717_12665 [Marinilabiliaceae bacterium]|nr:hypothetical protein [Marinilabiliaceae bacterium]
MNNLSYLVIIGLLLTDFILHFDLSARELFDSNKVVVLKDEGIEMMPFAKGEVLTRNVMDDQYLSAFPRNHVNQLKICQSDIKRIVSTWKEILPPKGFRVTYFNYIDQIYNQEVYDLSKDDPAPIISGHVSIVFHPYYKGDNGQPVIDPEVNAQVAIHLNDIYILAGSPLVADIHVCPKQTDIFHGCPIFQTNRHEITIVSKKNIPFFIPVSRQDLIETFIKYWENYIQKEKQQQIRPESQQNMQSLAGESALRKVEMKKAYNELLKYDKNAAEQLKKSFYEVEAAIASEAAGSEGTLTQSDLIDNSIQMALETIVALRQELATMPQSERQQQAYYNANAMEQYNNRSGLVPINNNYEGMPLIRVNSALVDPNDPSIQLMVIQWYYVGNNSDRPRFYNEGKEGYLLAAWNMAQLYQQELIWNELFNIVHGE